MVRFGLCCIFVEEPVKFRTVTAKTLLSLPQEERLEKIGDICLGNAKSLLESLRIVRRLGIGAFRILSSLFPAIRTRRLGTRWRLFLTGMKSRRSSTK